MRPLKATYKFESDEQLTHDTEFEKLKRKKHTLPYWHRVSRMTLTPAQRDGISYTINKFSDLAEEGYRWKFIGDILYSVQIITSSLVPVLIGLVGTFDKSLVDTIIRIIAILFSISGTIATSIENVQKFRGRGQMRIQYADRMNTLFQFFDARTGHFHKFDNFENMLAEYMKGFHTLLEETRSNSFVGQYKKEDALMV